ncbi:MAG: hypothetical protein Q7K21_03010, partial [Elusimicrobiota bacterium]|nr:hypothetical protein [Elusimicrobiota bacterium]
MKSFKYNITLWPRWIDLLIIYGVLFILFLTPFYWGTKEKGFIVLFFTTLPAFVIIGLWLIGIYFVTKSIDIITVLWPWIGAISLLLPWHYIIIPLLLITIAGFTFWKKIQSLNTLSKIVIIVIALLLVGLLSQITSLILSNFDRDYRDNIFVFLYLSYWVIMTLLVFYCGIKKIKKGGLT